jgi:hypothetical protein
MNPIKKTELSRLTPPDLSPQARIVLLVLNRALKGITIALDKYLKGETINM